MEYFFVLGRNPLLSRAELFSYLESYKMQFKEILFERNFLVLELNEFKFDIQEFGGLIKLGRILFKGTIEGFQKFIDKEDLVNSDKFSYSVLGNVNDDFFIKKFKSERRKAIIRRGSKYIKFQDEEFFSIPNAEVDFFSYEHKDKIFFGIVNYTYSYSEVKKRDMQKPVRRESLAISPRLAKILINLSQARKGNLLLDPFCGIGAILQEALIRGINVYGVDKDRDAIEGAEKNLKWLKSNFDIKANYKLLNKNSSMIRNIPCWAIATEPTLGEALKKRPDNAKAKFLIESFEGQIIPVLKNLARIKKPGARIAMTLPFIREFSVNLKNVEKQTGLRIYKQNELMLPIKEFREDQFISREIIILI
ncbi:MAG: hypothetical protein ACOYT4_02835 [Nanoarchaeota archaeon]